MRITPVISLHDPGSERSGGRALLLHSRQGASRKSSAREEGWPNTFLLPLLGFRGALKSEVKCGELRQPLEDRCGGVTDDGLVRSPDVS